MPQILMFLLLFVSTRSNAQQINLPTSGIGTGVNTIQTINQVDQNIDTSKDSFHPKEQQEDLGFSYNDEAHRERIRKIKRDESKRESKKK